MVRINFRTLIIFCFCFCSADTPSAELEEIVLESHGKYKVKSSVRALRINADEELTCEQIETECEVNQKKLEANVTHATGHKKNGCYFFLAQNIKIKFENIRLESAKGEANTQTNEIRLNAYNGQYRDMIFNSTEPLRFHQFNFYAQNVNLTAANWKIKIQKAQMNPMRTCFIKDVAMYQKNVCIKINECEFNMDATKMLAKNITLEKRIEEDTVKIFTSTAEIFNENNIIFPETIVIDTKHITLTAQNGKKEKNIITLHNIHLKDKGTNKISGYCKHGYFDIQANKFVLLQGKIKRKK